MPSPKGTSLGGTGWVGASCVERVALRFKKPNADFSCHAIRYSAWPVAGGPTAQKRAQPGRERQTAEIAEGPLMPL